MYIRVAGMAQRLDNLAGLPPGDACPCIFNDLPPPPKKIFFLRQLVLF